MEAQSPSCLRVITGLTASGKSALALEVARRLRQSGTETEIICCDSMLVYRDLDIGTDKPSRKVQDEFAHHCLDLVYPNEAFSVGDYIRAAQRSIAEVQARGALPLVVGGTGLYLRGLTQGLLQLPSLTAREAEVKAFRELWQKRVETEGSCASLLRQLSQVDPESSRRIHCNDLYRLLRALEIYEFTGKSISAYQKEHAFAEKPFEPIMIAIDWPRATLYERINRRLEEMLNLGIENEIAVLLAKGYSPELRPLQALAYRYFIKAMQGQITRQEALAKTQQESRRFAKRQATWFRPLKNLQWLSGDEPLAALAQRAMQVFKCRVD